MFFCLVDRWRQFDSAVLFRKPRALWNPINIVVATLLLAVRNLVKITDSYGTYQHKVYLKLINFCKIFSIRIFLFFQYIYTLMIRLSSSDSKQYCLRSITTEEIYMYEQIHHDVMMYHELILYIITSW